MDTDPKFFKKEVELGKYEKEMVNIFTKIEKDKLLNEKVKAIVLAKK
jgi:hypothetical protein